jgi:integrase
LREVSERWLAANPSKRSRTLSHDEAILTNALDMLGAQRAVGSVTPADVQRLVDTWKADRAPSTVKRMYSALRAMFNYAVAAEMIVRTPCRNIRVPAAELVDRPVLDADQLQVVADALGDHGPMVWLGAVLGLRWGEVAGLRVGDLDILGGQVSVTGQLGRDRVRSAPKSTAGLRTLAAPRWLLDMLAAHLAVRGLSAADADALVFVNRSGGPLNYTAWRRIRWAPAATKAGLSGLRFHDLRSVAASAMVAEGVDVKTAQKRLGHANPALTLAIYARATADADRRAADAVGERFRPRDGRAMVRRSRSGSSA